ncbi:MAG: DNA-binding transcriptional ArsR family regulator [Maribacter sp.]|jgi:DNA-binding transcriptional ArsR family regulator
MEYQQDTEVLVRIAKALGHPTRIAILKYLGNESCCFTEKLVSTDPKDNFSVTEIIDFQWNPELRNDFIKTDILNKEKLKCIK